MGGGQAGDVEESVCEHMGGVCVCVCILDHPGIVCVSIFQGRKHVAAYLQT